MESQLPTRSNAADVDIALPLQWSESVDVDLPLVDEAPSAQRAASPGAESFQPTMSQVAARASVPRVRWPNRSRAGYHGGSPWNWMRDGRADFAERSIGGL